MVDTDLQVAMELEDNTSPHDAPVLKKPVGMPERVKIMLEEDENIPPGGLFIGCNGASYKLMPGMEAMVPVGVVDILDNAVMTVAVLDPLTKQTVGYRNKRRYSYRKL